MAEPVLSKLDRQSAVWVKIKQHAEARLTSLRARNDKDREERETARIRGAIGELKSLLALDQDAPPAPSEEQFRD